MKVSPSSSAALVDKIVDKLIERFGKVENTLYVHSAWINTSEFLVPNSNRVALAGLIRRWWAAFEHKLLEVNYPLKLWDDVKDVFYEFSDEGLLKVAVDLGLEVPGLVPAVPQIQIFISERMEDVAINFENLIKKAYKEPADAVTQAETYLAEICAQICKVYNIKLSPNASSHKAMKNLLEGMKTKVGLDPVIAEKMETMSDHLIEASKGLHDLRTNHTDAHTGKGEKITDPLVANFCINIAATVGLLLLNVYHEKVALRENNQEEENTG